MDNTRIRELCKPRNPRQQVRRWVRTPRPNTKNQQIVAAALTGAGFTVRQAKAGGVLEEATEWINRYGCLTTAYGYDDGSPAFGYYKARAKQSLQHSMVSVNAFSFPPLFNGDADFEKDFWSWDFARPADFALWKRLTQGLNFGFNPE